MKKILKIFLALVLVILLCMSFFTLSRFGGISPITASSGFFRVLILGEDYARVSLLPRAYLLQPTPEASQQFLEAMAGWGYTHHPEEQMGALHWFETEDGQWFKLCCRSNAYYTVWYWC